jgi:hypothetical protein
VLIRVKKTWKDHVEGPAHQGITRRDLIRRGLVTGALSMVLPKMFGVELVKSAHADALKCPTATKNPGAIVQLYSNGGATMGSRFFGDQQADAMNATMAANYGISGTNLKRLGPNFWIDTKSVFGATIMAGPPGFVGNWETLVLNKVSAGGHLGPFTADDGAGDSGLLGAVSPYKTSQVGKDLFIDYVNSRAPWAHGTPAANIAPFGTASATNLQSPFSLSPLAATNTSPAEMTNAAGTANALAQALGPLFNTAGRKGGNQLLTSAGCSFFGNATIADPAFATTLFDPTKIAALNAVMGMSSLTTEEMALSTAFYQSAVGSVGGVCMAYGGRDYHGTDPQTVIMPADMQDARAVVMFLAACHAAQQPGTMIYVSNGQCISKGTQAVSATLNGTAVTLDCPTGGGDAGGLYNGGLMLFYHPKGSVPQAKFTGTPSKDMTSGGYTVDGKIGTPANAIAGLFLTAHKYISGQLPAALLAKMQTAGIAPAPNDLLLF